MCLNKITEVIIIMKKVELVEAVAEATGLTKVVKQLKSLLEMQLLLKLVQH